MFLTVKLAGISSRPALNSGVALILVLWMLTLLSAIAGNLVFSSRTELQAMGNLSQIARAEAAADAGIHAAIASLAGRAERSTGALPATALRPDGLPRVWEFEAVRVVLQLSEENGKLELNAAAPEFLRSLFIVAGADAGFAEQLADAIADWRDPDDLRRLHGAEREDYTGIGRPGQIANANFSSVDQLQQVLGVTPVLFRAIAPLVTVHSQQTGVNPATAPRGVLLAIQGATPETVDAYITQREALLAQGLPAPPFPAPPGWLSTNTGGAVSIRATALLGDNLSFSREAVVSFTGSANAPFRILAWRSLPSS